MRDNGEESTNGDVGGMTCSRPSSDWDGFTGGAGLLAWVWVQGTASISSFLEG